VVFELPRDFNWKKRKIKMVAGGIVAKMPE
jgi:hypothetical protein